MTTMMAIGTAGPRADRDGAGLAGRESRAGQVRSGPLTRQVGEQGRQVGGGAGLQGPADPVVEFVGGKPASLEVLAQLGDGAVTVGVG